MKSKTEKTHSCVTQLHKENIRTTKCNAVINTTAEVESHIFYSERSQSSNNKHISNTFQLSHGDWNSF